MAGHGCPEKSPPITNEDWMKNMTVTALYSSSTMALSFAVDYVVILDAEPVLTAAQIGRLSEKNMDNIVEICKKLLLSFRINWEEDTSKGEQWSFPRTIWSNCSKK